MGRGGIRWGAGRPGWHIKAEYCHAIDVRGLHRDGFLAPGVSGVCRWSDERTGRETGSIGFSTEATAIVLDFRLDGVPIQQRVPILHSDCYYGGTRPWFACPRCGKRLAILYSSTRGFACRICNRVAYCSQGEGAIDRLHRKKGKIERRLDKGWKRPKGMHQATRDRLVRQIIELGSRWHTAMDAAGARMFPGMDW